MHYFEFTYFDGSKETFKDYNFGTRENALAFANEMMDRKFAMVGNELINISYIARIRIMEE